MSQRFLKIKNFKNIGITKGEDEYQTLYLNNGLHKDKIGELIILIGENNVGKSNVLELNITEKGNARGNIFKKLCDNEKFKDKLSVIQLTEIDNSFKDIENLFSQNDKEKFKPMIENKSISLSSLLKNTIFHSELDTKTADNFNKVLVF